mgnify:FL=1
MGSVYQVNKGINRSIEFKGIRAQYLGYFALGLLLLFLLFAALYVLGLWIWFCIAIVGGLGTLLYVAVMRLSHRFGSHGLMKYFARKALPCYLAFRSRGLFLSLGKEACDEVS